MATVHAVDELITQVRAAAAAGLDYLGLYGALALPDICGALRSENGWATPSKYRAWIRDNVPEHAGQAKLIYGLRCALLHQGSALPHGGGTRVAFTFSGTGAGIHNLTTVVGDDEVFWLHIPVLVEELASGAERWLAQFGNRDRVRQNLENVAHLRPEGLPPHVAGRVIA